MRTVIVNLVYGNTLRFEYVCVEFKEQVVKMNEYVKKTKNRRECSFLFAVAATIACIGSFFCSSGNPPSLPIAILFEMILLLSTIINVKISQNQTEKAYKIMFFPLFINFVLFTLALFTITSNPDPFLLVFTIFLAQICMFST